jgi:predicted CoA-substrate-specific enzyme activase
MLCVGIDAGSRAIKIVLMDVATDRVITSGVADQGVEHNALAISLYEQVLDEADRDPREVSRVVATGYARSGIEIADATITEITCHARGVHRLIPDVKTIVEIGGQDSKLVRLNGDGVVYDFAMNDRCAAGTGRFLEMVTARLGVELHALGDLARQSRKPAAISSMCAVFAETEIIGLLASGVEPSDIAAGVQASVASRVAAMAGRKVDPPVVFTGGVAMIPGMVDALSMTFGQPVSVAPGPQMTGALGAAIVASTQLRKEAPPTG